MAKNIIAMLFGFVLMSSVCGEKGFKDWRFWVLLVLFALEGSM